MVDQISAFAVSITDPGMLAALFAALAAFGTIMTVALPMMKTDKLETRLKSVTNRREQLRRQSRAEINERGIKRADKGFMKSTVEKLDLQKALEDPGVKDKLVQAGLRGPGPLSAFYFFRFATADWVRSAGGRSTSSCLVRVTSSFRCGSVSAFSRRRSAFTARTSMSATLRRNVRPRSCGRFPMRST